MSDLRRACWVAKGSASVRGGVKEWTIAETATKECPVSLIDSETLGLLEIVSANRTAKESGASIFGPVAAKWPARFFDADQVIRLAESEYLNQEHALINASNR